MIENTSTLYKMIILYMLEKVTFPLSNSQITRTVIFNWISGVFFSSTPS